MKSKKLLSLLLALMMMLSVVPMYASAADPIALTEANITTYPTANGSIYFGQKISDGISLSGGEVQYDGAVVAGHFEIVDPEVRPTSSSSSFRLDIKFIPDDMSSYTGFEITRCKNVTCAVNKTTPVFVDENDTVPVATEVDPGAKLSTSTLSGAKVMNPYYPEETKALAGVWKWTTGTTIVNESGYYEARITISNYERLYAQVYVKVKENTVNTTIAEAPSVGELTYDANKTWADATLTGGKAVEEGTETEVTGTFAITKVNGSSVLWNKVITDGDIVEITFTPADTDKYLTSTTTVTVTVNKAPIKFVDENGADVVPEITVPYGTKFNDISRLLRPYVKGPEYVYFAMGDLESQLCANGTYTVTATAPDDSEHYEATELTFKIVVEKKVINPKVYSSTEGYYVQDNSGVYHVEGTFDVYVNDELIASDIKYLEGKVKWEATENGTYELKFVYNPVENDNFIIDDVVITKTVIFPNTITYNSDMSAYILTGNGRSELYETTERTPGTSVTIGCDLPAFAAWVITDANGNAVDLGVDLTAAEITFTMPDYDITIEAKTAETGDDDTGDDDDSGITLPDLDLDTDGSHKFSFVNIIKNLVEMIKDFIQQIGDFFSNMSLDSLGEVIG